jgi:hypothetical protein
VSTARGRAAVCNLLVLKGLFRQQSVIKVRVNGNSFASRANDWQEIASAMATTFLESLEFFDH